MTRIFAFLITLLLSIPAFSQNSIPVHREVRKIDREFSIDKVYSKRTGEKISADEYRKMVAEDPNFPMERVIDNRGKVTRYLVDLPGPPSPFLNNWSEKINPGEDFPALEFTTVTGEKVKLKDLRGKIVIIRIETDANTPRFRKQWVENTDRAIEASPHKDEIAAIILFMNSVQQVKQGFDYEHSNFKAVADAANFTAKLNIRSFPTTLIIDKQGRLLEELPRMREVNLSELLKSK